MVIKRKNLTTNVTLLPHTLTLPNSVRPAPGTGWRSAGISCVSWFRVLPPSEWCRDFQCPGTKAPSPARGWCPSPFYLYIFTSVSTSRKTAYFSFLAWSFFTVTLLCCNIGINAKKKNKIKIKLTWKCIVWGNGIFISHGGKVSKVLELSILLLPIVSLNYKMFMFDRCLNNGILLWIIPLTETLNITVYIIRKTGIFLNLKI